MKRAIIAGLGLYLGWLEFSDDLAVWLPAWGAAIDAGYIWGQVVILGFLALAISGTVVWTGYRFLGWALD